MLGNNYKRAYETIINSIIKATCSLVNFTRVNKKKEETLTYLPKLAGKNSRKASFRYNWVRFNS